MALAEQKKRAGRASEGAESKSWKGFRGGREDLKRSYEAAGRAAVGTGRASEEGGRALEGADDPEGRVT